MNFKTLQDKTKNLLIFNKNTIVSKIAIRNLRLNWENISSAEFKKACYYLRLTSSQKIKKLFKLIEQEYYA